MLLQQGGLGGPYASIDTATLVSTALNGTTPLGVGASIPSNAQGSQVFTADLVTTLDGAHLWNQYEGTDGNQHYWNAGPAASAEYDPVGGFLWLTTPAGNPGQVVQGATELMTLSPAGALNLLYGTLSVARDPATAFEVATLNYVSNNTVQSFNQRQGQVQLNAGDVYSALKLCDPLATQPWVTQAIQNSIQNLLYTCPFVNTWNGRQGQVYLMLSDITCVFFQSGQQPISPTPPVGSNDNSIATTEWVTAAVEGAEAFLLITGGTIDPGPLIISNAAAFAPGVTFSPVGQYEMPPVPPAANWRSNIVSTLSTAADGGDFNDATLNAGMFVANIYGAPDFNVFDLVGQVNFNGTGGTGQHCALIGYGTRMTSVAQPTTTVAVTLGAPSNNVQVTDVTNLQVPYPTTIQIGSNGYLQIGVSGTSGPGTITVIPSVTVADGTAGNLITGKNNPQVWGSNIYANDISGADSLHTNALVGIELDIGANGLDNDGVLYHGAPFGNRTALAIVGLQADTSGAATEIGNAIAIGTGGGSAVTFKRCLTVFNQTRFSQAAFDTRDAVQLSGANAIWLGDGQTVAFDTAGSITASYTGNNLQFIDTTFNSSGQPDFTFAAPNNAYGLNIKLQGNGTTTPSKLIRVAGGEFYILNDAESTFLLTMDDSGNITVQGGLFRFVNLPISAADDAAAAAAGVQVGGLYHNASQLMIRVS